MAAKKMHKKQGKRRSTRKLAGKKVETVQTLHSIVSPRDTQTGN